MKRQIFFTFGFLMSCAPVLRAEMLSFEDVWQEVRDTSPAQEGAKLKTQSAEEGLSRAGNHWLPKVYLEARSYRTNDPGSAFSGLLEQRKVETADFSPDSLNHPAVQTFTRGALGVDLALYEGGMKQAQVEMYRHLAAVEKLGSAQIEVEQYAESGFAYGSIASAQRQKEKLKKLNDEIVNLLKGYQLGQKSNPVGYSGLLGMKTLANRVSGLIEQLEAQEKASYVALKEMGVAGTDWRPQILGVKDFVDRYFSFETRGQRERSYRSLAGEEAARATERAARIEKSRYFPKIGAYAESYVFDGSRAAANGYTAGLYLQWSFFDPSDHGKYQEASLASMAAAKLSQAAVQQENADREGLAEADRALRSNLLRLAESDRLLSEQTRVSLTLFKNGSVNALQFVEILNRRTDLILQQSEAEISLLRTSAERVKKTRFEIPGVAFFGGRK